MTDTRGMARMDLTVVICTRNRASPLRRTLENLAATKPSPGTVWELVVVDNGSTDETAELISSFADILPVRQIFEPRAGISNARNAGVDAARGAYIIWTDDDVDVGAEWLKAYQRAFRVWPDAAVFGGPISPLLETPSPAWFAQNIDLLHLLLATRDFGALPRPLCVEADIIPFGANFAVRAAEQKQFRYDPEAGAGSGNFRLGEETAVIKQILLSRATGYWVPDAAVTHRIAVARQSLAYVEDYFIRLGRTGADDTYIGMRRRRRGGVVEVMDHGGLLCRNRFDEFLESAFMKSPGHEARQPERGRQPGLAHCEQAGIHGLGNEMAQNV